MPPAEHSGGERRAWIELWQSDNGNWYTTAYLCGQDASEDPYAVVQVDNPSDALVETAFLTADGVEEMDEILGEGA